MREVHFNEGGRVVWIGGVCVCVCVFYFRMQRVPGQRNARGTGLV